MLRFRKLVKSVAPRAAWATLKRARIRYTQLRFRQHQVRHTYAGFPLEICIADPLGRGWYDHDWPRMAEFELLNTHRLREGARVFDLGAHQCVVALVLAKIVGPHGQVVAVEATAHDVEVGRRNRALNAADNLEILHGAIAACSGQITFTLDGHVDDGHRKAAKVPTEAFSIDELAERFGPPDVLFIDVEGYECEALRGAVKTLRQRPDAFVEVHVGAGLEDFGGSVREVLNFFPPEEFRLFGGLPDGEEFVPLTATSECLHRHFYLVALGR